MENAIGNENTRKTVVKMKTTEKTVMKDPKGSPKKTGVFIF